MDDSLYGAPLLSADEERALFLAYRETRDPAIRERLILANTRLVRKIASHYHPADGSMLEQGDLEMEGMMGLMRAIERFDPSRGTKFSTIATRWIQQAIQRTLGDQAQLIREPIHVQEKRKRAWRHGGKADARELRPSWQVVSLDKPTMPFADDAEETSLKALIPAAGASVEEQAIARADHGATLYQALGRLLARERYVIELRYGLSNDGDGWTLEAIGASMKVSRERVRQIEVRALTHLRQMLAEHADGDVVLRLLQVRPRPRPQVKSAQAKPKAMGRPRKADASPHAVAERERYARRKQTTTKTTKTTKTTAA